MRRDKAIRRLSVIAATGVAGMSLATAASASAPQATTGPTTAVSSSSATVTGSVEPGGEETTWHVEYGTSTSYGAKTASTSAGAGTAAVTVSAALSGLRAGTTYHYRVVATNDAGTSHGGDGIFTTLSPPGVSTGAASSITTSAATLTGTVDPKGRATTYRFEYGLSTAYGSQTGSSSAGSGDGAISVSARVSGLATGATYHYRLVATSDAGTSTGKDATFTTSSIPSAVARPASSVSPTSAKLHGAVTPNGQSTTWWFEYGTSTGYGSHTSSHSAGSGRTATSVAATVKSLKPGTTYHYRLVARNASGTVYSADAAFATTGAPLSQTGSAQNVTADAAVLTGTVDTHGRATTWWFEYGGSTTYGHSTPSRSAGSRAGLQAVGAQLSNLTPGATYHFRLVTKSDAGKSYGADATFSTPGVTLSAVARAVVFGGRIRLSGSVPTADANEQVVVWAKPFGGGSFRSVATLRTDASGAWAYLARPAIGTDYQATWDGGMSQVLAIGVHPRIAFTRLSSGRLLVRVAGGRSFAHRLVRLERRVGTHWKTIRQVRLGRRSRVELRTRGLPKGRSTLRIAFSVNQAGSGFLGATSRPLSVRIT